MSETVSQAFFELAKAHNAEPMSDLGGTCIDTVSMGYGYVKLLNPLKAEFRSGDITTCVTNAKNFNLAMEMFSPRIKALYDAAMRRGLQFELLAGHKRYRYDVRMIRDVNGSKAYCTFTDINQFNLRMQELAGKVVKNSLVHDGIGYIQGARDLLFLGVPCEVSKIKHPAAPFFPVIHEYNLQDLKDATPELA